MGRKTFIAIIGVILVLIGLSMLYFGKAPLPSLLIVAGYILFAFGLLPEIDKEDKKVDDDNKKKKEA